SMRSSILPPTWRADSQLKSAVRAPPTCREPGGEGGERARNASVTKGVGEGAKRTRTVSVTKWLREETAECQISNVQFRNSSFDIRDWTFCFRTERGGFEPPIEVLAPITV